MEGVMKKGKFKPCRWLKPSDVAQKFGVSKKTVQSWCRLGILPCRKFGPRLWLINVEKFDDFLGSGL
jgi:excisionase family DNA binding protein